MKSHNAESVGTHDNGDDIKASLNVRKAGSRGSTEFTPGGGEILRGLGDNLKLVLEIAIKINCRM